ncbi:MAG: hypothetical protein PHV62_01575 [Sulfuricurvum sp.]|nr:hypothetical protein [Sulfuricurvum sp.]
MKKIILLSIALLMSAGSLHAHGRSHGYYVSHDGWLFPFVLGGILGSTVSRQTVVYDPQPRIIYTSPPTTIIRETEPEINVQQSDDVGIGEPVYEERWVYFEDCKCERKVLINTQH